MKKGGSFLKERFLFFQIVDGGGFDPQPPRVYATAYMPLKKTPIYLLLHSNRNDKNAVLATHLLLLHHNQSISRLIKKVGWNRRNFGNFEFFANLKEGRAKGISFQKR